MPEDEINVGQESQDQQGAQNVAGTEDTQNNNQEENKTEKTFTQHQVSAMMSKEKKQGKAAAYAELGIDPKDTKMISMFKAFVEAQKTDEQKVAEEASKQAAMVAEAERRAMMAEAKAEALQAGVKSDYVDDCVTVAISKVTNDTSLADALKELKGKYPIWFGSDDSDKGSVGQKGTGTSISKMGSTAGSANKGTGLAAQLAVAKKSGNTASKNSFWS